MTGEGGVARITPKTGKDKKWLLREICPPLPKIRFTPLPTSVVNTNLHEPGIGPCLVISASAWGGVWLANCVIITVRHPKGCLELLFCNRGIRHQQMSD